MEQITSTARERFVIVLTGQYEHLFTLPEYALAAREHTPAQLAEAMTAGLEAGAADKSGIGVRNTLRVLGIKDTYEAIRAFLKDGSK